MRHNREATSSPSDLDDAGPRSDSLLQQNWFYAPLFEQLCSSWRFAASSCSLVWAETYKVVEKIYEKSHDLKQRIFS